MLNSYSLADSIDLWGLATSNPYEAMLLDFVEAHARALATQVPVPATLEDWQQRAEALAAPLLYSLGLTRTPARSPLQAKTMGQLARDGYVIEKVIYEPRPGFPTPAHLYVPQAHDGPMPAVLYAMGHYMENAKLDPEVQHCCANLARLGFVVLVYDAIGQGERRGDGLDHGHLEPLLVGLCQESLMVWESMRALDYLVSRPEVDGERIGMTGSSGGGLNTFYTAAVDKRIRVSVPVCFVTTFFLMMSSERDRNWEDGMDLCNQVPGILSYAEMSDILGLFAPQPLRIIAAQHDELFPVSGTRQIYARLRWLYQQLEAEDQVDLVEIDAPHSYNQAMRESAYGWFVRWLQNKGDGSSIPEQECELLPVAHPGAYLRPRQRGFPAQPSPGLCFPAGRVARPGPAITALALELAMESGPQPCQPPDPAAWDEQRQNLLARVRLVTGLGTPEMQTDPCLQTYLASQRPWPLPRGQRSQRHLAPRARILNRVQHSHIIAERVLFASEPGITVPGLFMMPNQWETHSRLILYVDEWGKRAGLHNGLFERLLAAGFAVLAVDVRGWGETGASDFEATTNALMTDRPLFGQRLWDLLETIQHLCAGGYVSGRIDCTRIGCIGQGAGALLALYAAALDERIAAAVLWQSPLSYRTLIRERPDFPPSVFLFDVLRYLDLPDLMAATAPRPLMLADPVDGRRQPLTHVEAAALCAWPQTIYAQQGAAAGTLHVHIGDHDTISCHPIVNWLEGHL